MINSLQVGGHNDPARTPLFDAIADVLVDVAPILECALRNGFSDRVPDSPLSRVIPSLSEPPTPSM